MPAYVSTLIYVMALGTVVFDIALVVKLLALLYAPWRMRILKGEYRYGLISIFVLSCVAVAGTLIMQYAGNLQPCVLCWWQRVFMYPIPLIALIALVKGQTISDIADYVLGLSFLGFLIALYQHLLQVLPTGALLPCDASNDCAVRSVFEFHFVTIPWMAATVFATLFLVALLTRKRT